MRAANQRSQWKSRYGAVYGKPWVSGQPLWKQDLWGMEFVYLTINYSRQLGLIPLAVTHKGFFWWHYLRTIPAAWDVRSLHSIMLHNTSVSRALWAWVCGPGCVQWHNVWLVSLTDCNVWRLDWTRTLSVMRGVQCRTARLDYCDHKGAVYLPVSVLWLGALYWQFKNTDSFMIASWNSTKKQASRGMTKTTSQQSVKTLTTTHYN